MSKHLCLVLCCLTGALPGLAAEPGFKAVVEVRTPTRETLIDLKAQDQPLAGILETIAKRMGYDKVVFKFPVDGLRASCDYRRKPAWECLADLFQAQGITLGGNEVGDDYALTLYKTKKIRVSYAARGGLLACLRQPAAGSAVPDAPRKPPCRLSLFPEPGAFLLWKAAAVRDQRDAQGNACDLVGLKVPLFSPQQTPGKTPITSWPGLSELTVETSFEIPGKLVVAELSGLAGVDAPQVVTHEGKELFTFERDGRAFTVSFPSEERNTAVFQGGHGSRGDDSLIVGTGALVELFDAQGQHLLSIVRFEGDGQRMCITCALYPRDAALSLDDIRLRFQKPLTMTEEKLEMKLERPPQEEPAQGNAKIKTWNPVGPLRLEASCRIVLASDREGDEDDEDIYTMNADGSKPVNLTRHRAMDTCPAPSPDGKRIAFQSDREGHFDIYVMDADGGNLRNLTPDKATDSYVSWSPDGRKLLFSSQRAGDGRQDIYVMDADGKNVKPLTKEGQWNAEAAWSPDGKRIVFRSDREERDLLYVMDADGSNVRRVSPLKGFHQSPAWSPDGLTLVFSRQVPGTKNEIYLYAVRMDGSDPRQLSKRAGEESPVFTPDGRFILYSGKRDGRYQVCIMGADGADPQPLLQAEGNSTFGRVLPGK